MWALVWKLWTFWYQKNHNRIIKKMTITIVQKNPTKNSLKSYIAIVNTLKRIVKNYDYQYEKGSKTIVNRQRSIDIICVWCIGIQESTKHSSIVCLTHTTRRIIKNNTSQFKIRQKYMDITVMDCPVSTCLKTLDILIGTAGSDLASVQIGIQQTSSQCEKELGFEQISAM